jgi:hypothetical protein
MAQTFRGRAQVEGVTNAIDVILKKTMQSMKLTQTFDEEINKDEHGNDCAWKANNEKYEGDISLKLMSSGAGITVPDTRATVAAAAAFLAPYAVVTISTCEVTAWNTTYQVISGNEIDLGNTKVGDISFKLRRYADSTQNTLAATTPS